MIHQLIQLNLNQNHSTIRSMGRAELQKELISMRTIKQEGDCGGDGGGDTRTSQLIVKI